MSTGFPGERLLAYLIGAAPSMVRESVRVGTRHERLRREPFRREMVLYSVCVFWVRRGGVPLDFDSLGISERRRGKSYTEHRLKGGTTAKGTDEGIHAMSGRGSMACLRMMRFGVRGMKIACVRPMKLESVTRR